MEKASSRTPGYPGRGLVLSSSRPAYLLVAGANSKCADGRDALSGTQAPPERSRQGEQKVQSLAGSMRAGGITETTSALLNVNRHCYVTGSAPARLDSEGPRAISVKGDGGCASADQRQLRRVQFFDRVFHLRGAQGRPLVDFGLDDVHFHAELVHDVLRPIRL